MKVDEFVETYARWWFAPETNIPGDVKNVDRHLVTKGDIDAYVSSVPPMVSLGSYAPGDYRPHPHIARSYLWAIGEEDDAGDTANINHKYVANTKIDVCFEVVYDSHAEVFRARGRTHTQLAAHNRSLMGLLIDLSKMERK
jgi:hypothetical protein